MRKYVFDKVYQFKVISWVLTGFFLGSGINVFAIGSAVLAIVFDFLGSVLDTKSKTIPVKDYPDLWSTRKREDYPRQ